MANDNGWPDPSKPGVPLHPERDGWHWLVPSINHALPPGSYRWHAPPRSDVIGQWDAGYPQDVVRRGYDYLGPCRTPAEVAAALAAQAMAMREAIIARVHKTGLASPNGDAGDYSEWSLDVIEDDFRRLPLPDTSALDAMLAEARREGMREAAGIVSAREADAIRAAEESDARGAGLSGMTHAFESVALKHAAAAILAAAKEVKA
jgi:hypothetical protein